MNTERIRLGGNVSRFHTRHVIGRQSVAEHSWGVAMIINEMCHGCPPPELLMAALSHDVAEYDTGDLPSMIKLASPTIADAITAMEDTIDITLGLKYDLDYREKTYLKFADLLELVWFSYEQRKLGNRYAEEWWENGCKYLDVLFNENYDLLRKCPAKALFDEVKLAWANLFDGEPSNA